MQAEMVDLEIGYSTDVENSLLGNVEFAAQLENRGELDEAETEITAVADMLV